MGYNPRGDAEKKTLMPTKEFYGRCIADNDDVRESMEMDWEPFHKRGIQHLYFSGTGTQFSYIAQDSLPQVSYTSRTILVRDRDDQWVQVHEDAGWIKFLGTWFWHNRNSMSLKVLAPTLLIFSLFVGAVELSMTPWGGYWTVFPILLSLILGAAYMSVEPSEETPPSGDDDNTITTPFVIQSLQNKKLTPAQAKSFDKFLKEVQKRNHHDVTDIVQELLEEATTHDGIVEVVLMSTSTNNPAAVRTAVESIRTMGQGLEELRERERIAEHVEQVEKIREKAALEGAQPDWADDMKWVTERTLAELSASGPMMHGMDKSIPGKIVPQKKSTEFDNM